MSLQHVHSRPARINLTAFKTSVFLLWIFSVTSEVASGVQWPGPGRSGNSFAKEKASFLNKWGSSYGYGGRIDKLYAQEVGPRLSPCEHYLDYTAASLYWNSQVDATVKELKQDVFGNPHSASATSIRSTRLVEQLRGDLLKMWGADPDEYQLVFTRSASGALQDIGMRFPWNPHSQYIYTRSNHNSVLGLREHAYMHGATVESIDEYQVEAWLQSNTTELAATLLLGTHKQQSFAALSNTPSAAAGGANPAAAAAAASTAAGAGSAANAAQPGSSQAAAGAAGQSSSRASLLGPSRCKCEGPQSQFNQSSGCWESAAANARPTYSLFAYPAMDNYEGVLYPLSWVAAIQAKSNATHQWKVLLDTAAFVPHHALNLSQVKPDFAVVSFYKMFGYPTGVGALLIRRDAAELMQQYVWGGGSVFLATSTVHWDLERQAPWRFEVGTLPFLEILALQQGMQVYQALGGIDAIHRHADAVAEYLHEGLSKLQHSNGAPLIKFFGKWHHPEKHRPQVQGPIVNFEILRPDGQVFSYKTAGLELSQAGLYLRWGCTCNPGACYNSTGVTEDEVRQLAEEMSRQHEGEDWEEQWQWIWVNRRVDGADRKVRLPLGSLRASLGYMSRFEDAHALIQFIKHTYTDRWDEEQGWVEERAAIIEGLPPRERHGPTEAGLGYKFKRKFDWLMLLHGDC